MPNSMPGAMPSPQYATQPAQWQPQQRMPSPAHLASGAYNKAPITARGVAPSAPAASPMPAAVQRYALPSPQALGVSTSLSLAQPTVAVSSVDWNQLQTRMQRLGVLRYQKAQMENGAFQVTLLFPTADPTKGQPMAAQAATEGEAVLMILNHAEELARKR